MEIPELKETPEEYLPNCDRDKDMECKVCLYARRIIYTIVFTMRDMVVHGYFMGEVSDFISEALNHYFAQCRDEQSEQFYVLVVIEVYRSMHTLKGETDIQTVNLN